MSKHFGLTDPRKGVISLDFPLVVGAPDPKLFQGRPSVRVTAAPGPLGKRERAINLKMSLPLALFEAPQITATIAVEEPGRPVHIDAAAIGEAVRGVIGADVRIEVAQPEGGE